MSYLCEKFEYFNGENVILFAASNLISLLSLPPPWANTFCCGGRTRYGGSSVLPYPWNIEKIKEFLDFVLDEILRQKISSFVLGMLAPVLSLIPEI